MRSQLLGIVALFLLLSSRAGATERFSYVNGGPKLNVPEQFFAFYVGIWRGFDENEKTHIAAGADLLARRQTEWLVYRCRDGELDHRDGEHLWTYDHLQLDDEARVVPIVEAVRPDFRYFSFLNFNGLHMRGTERFRRPQRLPGESREDYEARKAEARRAWWERTGPRNMFGTIEVDLRMKLVDQLDLATVNTEFWRFEDYQAIAAQHDWAGELFARTAPSRWPVGYDERAHKPHHFFEPASWQNTSAIRSDRLRARIEWNWCADELQLRFVVPHDQEIVPGPNRQGRGGTGSPSLPVENGFFD